jgi:hypothetical protein
MFVKHLMKTVEAKNYNEAVSKAVTIAMEMSLLDGEEDGEWTVEGVALLAENET